MTATPGTKPAPKPPGEIPPFAIYRATTAHWADGAIKLLYTRMKGQGAKVLIEEHPGDEPIELGDQYQLTLTKIEEGGSLPPIEVPEFPELPTPEMPIKPEKPIYHFPEGVMPGRPVRPETPIGTLPPEGVMPTRPEFPGISKPPGHAETLPGEVGPEPK